MNNIISQQTDHPIPYQHHNEMPWLRLSSLSIGDPQQIYYLEKALQANPHNKQTLRLIERLDPQRAHEMRMWISVLSEVIDSV